MNEKMFNNQIDAMYNLPLCNYPKNLFCLLLSFIYEGDFVLYYLETERINY